VKFPIDNTPYPKDPQSQPISASTPDGGYAHVQDTSGIIHVLPDGPHVHPVIWAVVNRPVTPET
jgi:hypothetical protein